MNFMDVVRSRRSVRRFKSDKIPDYILEDMLEAARLAPSGGNSQSHCFGIIDAPDLKIKLAEAAGEQMWIATAPIVIACCADISWDLANCSDDDFGLTVNKLRFSDELVQYLIKYKDRKYICSLFQNAAPLIPAEHIFLTAVSHGLSACFVGFLDVERASKLLNLPENMVCLFLLPVGYPNEIPEEKSTKSIPEITFYNRWK